MKRRRRRPVTTPVTAAQEREILALAERLGPDALEEARRDLASLTTSVARFYIDDLMESLRSTPPR